MVLLVHAGPGHAQLTLDVVHAFQCGDSTDGCLPLAGLTEGRDGVLYGTTEERTVFKVQKDGSGFAVLHSFDCGDSCRPVEAGLTQGEDGALYGMTEGGGSSGGGFVYRLAGVVVDTPAGGGPWPIGSTQAISWSAIGLTGNVKIEVSRDGGTTWKLITASTPNDAMYSWKVTGPATAEALIRATGLKDPTMSSTSGAFQIGGGTLEVQSPSSGQVWAIGSRQDIAWQASGFTGNVKIEVSRNGGGDVERAHGQHGERRAACVDGEGAGDGAGADSGDEPAGSDGERHKRGVRDRVGDVASPMGRGGSAAAVAGSRGLPGIPALMVNGAAVLGASSCACRASPSWRRPPLHGLPCSPTSIGAPPAKRPSAPGLPSVVVSWAQRVGCRSAL